MIEAHWLFGVPAERISVLIHPQSIVHSMVEFGDGAIKAQLGSPDMRTPIAYALSFPQRLDRPVAPFSFAEHPTLTFAESIGSNTRHSTSPTTVCGAAARPAAR